jgi:hypothetical protein
MCSLASLRHFLISQIAYPPSPDFLLDRRSRFAGIFVIFG